MNNFKVSDERKQEYMDLLQAALKPMETKLSKLQDSLNTRDFKSLEYLELSRMYSNMNQLSEMMLLLQQSRAQKVDTDAEFYHYCVSLLVKNGEFKAALCLIENMLGIRSDLYLETKSAKYLLDAGRYPVPTADSIMLVLQEVEILEQYTLFDQIYSTYRSRSAHFNSRLNLMVIASYYKRKLYKKVIFMYSNWKGEIPVDALKYFISTLLNSHQISQAVFEVQRYVEKYKVKLPFVFYYQIIASCQNSKDLEYVFKRHGVYSKMVSFYVDWRLPRNSKLFDKILLLLYRDNHPNINLVYNDAIKLGVHLSLNSHRSLLNYRFQSGQNWKEIFDKYPNISISPAIMKQLLIENDAARAKVLFDGATIAIKSQYHVHYEQVLLMYFNYAIDNGTYTKEYDTIIQLVKAGIVKPDWSKLISRMIDDKEEALLYQLELNGDQWGIKELISEFKELRNPQELVDHVNEENKVQYSINAF